MSGFVLGIDTSTRVCVGLARSGDVLVSRTVGDSRSHVELLMPTIAGLFAEVGISAKNLDMIAVGMGPGPFTGLRVGVATGYAMAEVVGAPVAHVCSLDVIGLQWADRRGDALGEPFVTATDARRKELYWAVYDARGRRVGPPEVSPPAQLPALRVVGPGAIAYPDAGAGGASDLGIDAGYMAAHVTEFVDVGPEPMYLRRADAVPPVSVKSALPPQERAT